MIHFKLIILVLLVNGPCSPFGIPIDDYLSEDLDMYYCEIRTYREYGVNTTNWVDFRYKGDPLDEVSKDSIWLLLKPACKDY